MCEINNSGTKISWVSNSLWQCRIDQLINASVSYDLMCNRYIHPLNWKKKKKSSNTLTMAQVWPRSNTIPAYHSVLCNPTFSLKHQNEITHFHWYLRISQEHLKVEREPPFFYCFPFLFGSSESEQWKLKQCYNLYIILVYVHNNFPHLVSRYCANLKQLSHLLAHVCTNSLFVKSHPELLYEELFIPIQTSTKNLLLKLQEKRIFKSMSP